MRELYPGLASTAVAANASEFPLDGHAYTMRFVDDQFFVVLDLQPMVGGFAAVDFDEAGVQRLGALSTRPVLISDRLWRTTFGAKKEVIGRLIVISEREGVSFRIRIVGVLSPSFVFPLDDGDGQPDLIAPLGRNRLESSRRDLQLLVRLDSSQQKDLLTYALAAAPGRFASLPRDPHSDHIGREQEPFRKLTVEQVPDRFSRRAKRIFKLLLWAGLALLAVTCVNAAGLTVARTIDQREQILVRRALGASTLSIVQQPLTELTVLVTAAAGLGYLVAKPMLLWTTALIPHTVTFLRQPVIDARSVATTAGLAVTGALLVSIWPAVATARDGLSRVVTLGTSSAGAIIPRRRSAYSVLIAAQVAIGLVVALAGALSVASLVLARANEVGYRAVDLLLLEVHTKRFVDASDAATQLQVAIERLRHVPGVQDVAVSTVQSTFLRPTLIGFPTVPLGAKSGPEGIALRQVTSNFFTALGMRLVAGRWPVGGEWGDEGSVTMVSETAAGRLWPNQDPIGRALMQLNDRELKQDQGNEPRRQRSWTVMGVVSDARFVGYDEEPMADVYVPGPLTSERTGALVYVRVTGDTEGVLRLLLQEANTAGLRVDRAGSHMEGLRASLLDRALPAWLFGVLAAITVTVVLTGVGALLAMSLVHRKREIAVRFALGATRAKVVQLLVVEQLLYVGRGVMVGVVASLWSLDYLRSHLYRLSPHNPLVWGGVILSLLALAALAALLRARRAAATDPVVALRG